MGEDFLGVVQKYLENKFLKFGSNNIGFRMVL